MAKVMISLPGETLRMIDEFAEMQGMSRSGFLRELAEREIEENRQGRASRIREILGSAEPEDGASAAHVREARNAR